MKKLIVTLLLAVSAASLHAQGTVLFNNLFGTGANAVNAPITDGGAKVAAGYFAQLWAAPAGSQNFQPIGAIVPFRTGGFAGYVSVGSAGSRTIDAVTPGSMAAVQIRAWAGAAGSTFDGASKRGMSSTLTLATGNVPDPATGVPSPPSPLVGLQGFDLVPEPSTIALAVLGFGSLLLFRRRK